MTHQHPPQTAKIVSLSPPVCNLLEADSMAQPYELLTNIHHLGETTVLHRVCKKTAERMRNKPNRYLENKKYLKKQLTLPSLVSQSLTLGQEEISE